MKLASDFFVNPIPKLPLLVLILRLSLQTHVLSIHQVGFNHNFLHLLFGSLDLKILLLSTLYPIPAVLIRVTSFFRAI